MILDKKTWLAAFLLCMGAGPALARPRVVATFSILGDWARQVAGPDAEVTVLVGAGGDAHVYEPSPADARALAGADVVVELGLGFEPWLDKLVAASGGGARRVRVTAGLPLRAAGGVVDPHVWGDPTRAARAVEALRDGLAVADPAHAAGYSARAGAYARSLAALDRWIRVRSAQVPPARRLLVTIHDDLGYWADRYGFRVVGCVLPSFSTEAADPSAAHVGALAEKIRSAGAPAVFVESSSSDALARAVASAGRARLAPPIFVDALGPAGGPADTYVGMMKHDAAVIAEALK